jgi:hypothetical protein
MGAVNTSVQTTTQKQLNTITQQSSEACGATCTQIQSNNTVFLNGSTTGNITFNQQCTVDATCQITNSVEASATAVQGAIQSGTAQPAWFLGVLQVNTSVNVSDQEVTNAVSQVMNSTCNNGVSQVQSGNLVYAQNSTTGDIGFTQSTNLTSQCVLSNLAKGTVAATQKSDQYSQAGGIGAAGIILLIILVVVIIVVIGLAKAASNKKKEKAASEGSSTTSTGPLPAAPPKLNPGSAAKFVEANPELLLA